MASKVRALVVTGNGVNCEREMAHACELGGAETEITTIYHLIAGEVRLDGYQFLNLAGGFLDGDDLGSAKAGANRWRHAHVAGGAERLIDQLLGFVEADRLVFGVCNGFQLLVKLGLLPRLAGELEQRVTLTFNESGRFEDRWVHLATDPESPCLFTKGLQSLYLPVRHGEGKLVPRDADTLNALENGHLAPMRYAEADGNTPTQTYPLNPNGSANAIAALCDPSGRIFGMMPHPEAYTHRTNHPRWTRLPDLPEEGAGVALFRNAVKALG